MRHGQRCSRTPKLQRWSWGLGSALRKSSVHTALGTKQLLSELELRQDDDLYTVELREQLADAEAFADGQAGDRVKYLAAAKANAQKRWELFLAVADIDSTLEPTPGMAKRFAVFLFKTRQRRSKVGRTGLGEWATALPRWRSTPWLRCAFK